MITSIQITNFQTHADLEIKLDPHVTTIVGPSDVGKSAVIRALRWAALNIPVSSLIRDGAKKATVVVTADDVEVGRLRSGADNVYTMDGQEYRAFRTDVPDPISKFLNLDPINFQNQHDPVYWFSSTSGDVSRQLNAIVNLEIIDKTLAAITSIYNRAKTVVQVSEERLSEAVEERSSLDWVPDADKELMVVEQLESLAVQIEEDTKRLKSTIDYVELTHQQQEWYCGAAQQAEVVLDQARMVGQITERERRLSETIVLVQAADKGRCVLVPDLSSLGPACLATNEAMERLIILEDALTTAKQKQRQVDLYAEELEEQQQEFDRKVKGRCPLCGQEMK